MLKKKFCIALCCAILISGSLFGQEETLRLSVKDAENYAVEHNRSMKTASLEVKKADYTRWQAISSMLPQVSGAFGHNNYLGYEINLMGMPIAMKPTTNFTLQAGLGVSGQQIISTTISDVVKEMAQTNYEKSEQTIKSQVRKLYFSALAVENTIALLEQNMENMLTLETLTQRSAEVGVSEQTDVDQISVQVSSLRNTINSTRRSLEMIYNSLRLMLGTSVSAELILADRFDDVFSVENVESLLREQFSITKNLDYQLTEQSVELAKKQVRINEWAYGPQLSVAYQFTGKIQKTDFDMNPPQALVLTLNIPIFSSGTKLAKVNESKMDYQAALYNFETVTDQLQIQDRQLRFNLRSNLENYETQRKNIEVSQRVFTNISNKYEHGYSSSLDLTNASTNLIAAQSNYVQAMLELLNAQIELEELLNK